LHGGDGRHQGKLGVSPALQTHLDKVSQEPEPGFACKLAEMN